MRLTRLMTLLLAMTLALGPTLLDRCLISCHDDASSASEVPTCHEHPAPSDEIAVHGVTNCSHDHDGVPADSVTDARANTARHAAVSSAALEVYRPDLPMAVDGRLITSSRAPTSVSPPVITPLRV